MTVSKLIKVLEWGNLQGRNFKKTWPDGGNKSVIIDKENGQWWEFQGCKSCRFIRMSCPQMGFVVLAAGTVLSNFGSKRCEY